MFHKHIILDELEVELDADDLLRRAYAAYFRVGGTDQPNRSMSGLRKFKGRWYVVLVGRGGVMAAYRVRADGMLRRLKRWPKEVEKN